MALRGIRGATCLTADDADQMREAVIELIDHMLVRNGITSDALVSVLLTNTPDLVSAFPASGARAFGLVDVPLMCAQEIDVVDALPRTVRILFHAEIDVPRSEIQHVYLRGAEVLRPDVAS